MRIQHNIAALNSYRQLSGNNKALSKNLEKLSSGYKINRAGDDAAGLAISEKMRAQIKGLEAATKNANDGISLVQTAEGALTEVHDMLNRMTYLATQSANGTYDNETDRANLQKEVQSLLDEIDRISESTNYNGINLLDGTLGMNTEAFKVDNQTAYVGGTSKAANITFANTEAAKVVTQQAQNAKFDVTFENLSVEGDGMYKLSVGDFNVELELKDGATADDIYDALVAELAAKDAAAGTTNYQAVDKDGNKVKLDTSNTVASATGTDQGTMVGIGGKNYLVGKSTDGKGLAFVQIDKPTQASDEVYPDFAASLTAGNEKTTLYQADKASTFEVDLNALKTSANLATGDKLTLEIGGVTINSNAATGGEDKDTASALAALFDGTSATIKGNTYDISVTGAKLTFTNQATGEVTDASKLVADGTGVTVGITPAGGGTTTIAAGAAATTAAWDAGQDLIGTTGDAASFKIDLKGMSIAFAAGESAKTVEIEIETGKKVTSNTLDVSTTDAGASDIASAFDGKTYTADDGSVYDISVDADGTTLIFTAQDTTTAVTAPTTANATITTNASGQLTAPDSDALKDVQNGTANQNETIPAGTVPGKTITHVTNTQAGLQKSDGVLASTTFTLDFANLKDGTKLTVADKTYVFKIGEKSNTTAGTGETLVDLSNIEQADLATAAGKSKATTALVEKMSTSGSNVFLVGNYDADAGQIGLVEKQSHADLAQGHANKKDLSTTAKVESMVKMTNAVGAVDATTDLTLDATKMVAGDKIQIDGKTYEFVASADDISEDGNIAVVVDGLTNKKGSATTADVATALKNTLVNQGYTGTSSTGGKVTIHGGKANGTFSVQSNATVGSAGVKLQVGDTADDFNKVTVKVASMDTKSLGINDVDISTQEGAAAAIDKIKSAINSVSATRGDLGAIQNRLEHTINNIGVTKENITDAESRIRDTDMAEEMMAYTKNNILVQAAQSMLAQANQVPQGVLQLLQ